MHQHLPALVASQVLFHERRQHFGVWMRVGALLPPRQP
jgi:hypothetical protein